MGFEWLPYDSKKLGEQQLINWGQYRQKGSIIVGFLRDFTPYECYISPARTCKSTKPYLAPESNNPSILTDIIITYFKERGGGVLGYPQRIFLEKH
jgi:hypothetical protein